MSMDRDMMTISVNDVISTLQSYTAEKTDSCIQKELIYFASNLTGLSADALIEAMDEDDEDDT